MTAARERLGMDAAYVTTIDPQVQTLHAIVGEADIVNAYQGSVIPVEHTFCQRMLNGEIPNVVPDTRAEPVLLWGDARVGNMIFREDLTVAAALDWEVATIGPAEIDIAHWLFFDEFATDAVEIERLDGWPDRGSTVAEYEARSGRPLRNLEYFDVMQQLFMATTLIRQSDRRIALGRSDPDSRMGHDNTVTQMLARRLGLAVPRLSADYAAHRGLPTSTGATR